MSNPFARFGIDHLSPSSLNCYAANPSFWVCKYLAGMKDEPGPAASRGTAVEAGLDVWLFERNREKSIKAAYQNFHLNTNGLADDEHEAERKHLEPMVLRAIEAMKDVPPPNARQLRIEYWIDGVEVPVIGYVDYLFDEFGLDLKTTLRCPSSVKPDHGRQVAVYSKAKEKLFRLLYVTPSKSALYPLTKEEADMRLRDVQRQARAIRHLLSKSETAHEAARFFAPDPSDFRWNEKTSDFANEFYRAA